jgi:hypothetical protein
LACLCTFGSHFGGHTIWVIVWAVIAVAILALHAAFLHYYGRMHGFTRWQLWVVRVVEQCLCPVALPLYGSLTGILLRETIRTALSGDGVDVAHAVLFFVAAVASVIVALCYMAPYTLCCGSPVISYQALLCAWDARPMVAATATTLGLSFAAQVMDLFPGWMGPVLIGVCLVGWVFLVMKLRFFPFQRMQINYVYIGAAAGNGVLQLMAALRFVTDGRSFGRKSSTSTIIHRNLIAFGRALSKLTAEESADHDVADLAGCKRHLRRGQRSI